MPRLITVLLNVGHTLDHLFLLIFAAAVAAIAQDFGSARWEDLMPYTTGAFVMFGLASVPAGRLGDLWGRRRMMLLFFFGIGAAAGAVACAQTAWQLALALSVMGIFASIYHPVGIPMLLQSATRPGLTIGINGLSGNLGIALAALSTGLLVKYLGWRAAFIVPGLVSIACGLLFARYAPPETIAPARKSSSKARLPRRLAIRVFVVMVASATTGSLLFNLTTNGNAQLIVERLDGLIQDPAVLGVLLAGIYAVASLAQVVVGRLLDHYPIKPMFIGIVGAQIVLFLAAVHSTGWAWYGLAILYMISIFAVIPFNDTMVVRYIDDSMRSRVSGVRLAISFGISSLAVLLLGPLVKMNGFSALLIILAALASVTLFIVFWLPAQATLDAHSTA
jgi:MFS family permease